MASACDCRERGGKTPKVIDVGTGEPIPDAESAVARDLPTGSGGPAARFVVSGRF